jgi:hypothetical protein
MAGARSNVLALTDLFSGRATWPSRRVEPARVSSERTYHPAFKRVAGTELLSGSDYVAIGSGLSVPGQVRLIDRSTGRALTISQPGCGPDAVGGVWLAMTCGSVGAMSYALYDIPENRALPFTPPADVTAVSCGSGCPSIVGIGTDWIAMTPPCAGISKGCGSLEGTDWFLA